MSSEWLDRLEVVVLDELSDEQLRAFSLAANVARGGGMTSVTAPARAQRFPFASTAGELLGRHPFRKETVDGQ